MFLPLGPRMEKFNLTLAAEKTSLKRFSRFHSCHQSRFTFLGFDFYWDTDYKGLQRVRRRTSRKKHKASIKAYYDWIKLNRHRRLDHLIPELKRKMIGFSNYFGFPDNSLSLARINNHILHSLYKWLNRRSQRRSFNWQGFLDMLRYFQVQPMRVSKRNITVDWY